MRDIQEENVELRQQISELATCSYNFYPFFSCRKYIPPPLAQMLISATRYARDSIEIYNMILSK